MALYFTVTPMPAGDVYTGTITPVASPAVGTFSPPSLTFTGTSAAQKFQFIPGRKGTFTISTTSSPQLGTDPAPIQFTLPASVSSPSRRWYPGLT